MLGRRKIIDSKAGPYVWVTYGEAYDSALRIGSAIRSHGVNPGDWCGIYGSNCPEWIISMEACNSHAITYVPLYDTLAIVSFGEICSIQKKEAEDLGVSWK